MMILSKKHFIGSYNHIAENFSKTRLNNWGEFELLKKTLSKEAKVLDLGCGNGRSIKFLLQQETKPFGFDESEELLKIAKANYPFIEFIKGKMESPLPIKSESVDVVWSIASFHHLLTKKDRINTLGEIHRILKPNGKLVITVWNLFQAKFLTKRIEAFIRSIMPNWHRYDFIIPFGQEKHPRFYHAFKPDNLETLLEKNFFEIKDLFGSRGQEKVSFKEAHNICVIAEKKSRIKICQIPFDVLSKHDALNKIFTLSNNNKSKKILPISTKKKNLFSAKVFSELKQNCNKQKFITTPNPEMCIEASVNNQFLGVLNKSDLSLADGAGIIWASNFRSKFLFKAFLSLLQFLFSSKKIGNFQRTQGSDIFKDFCSKSQSKIFFLGGSVGIAEKCADYFKEINPNFNLAGTDSGSSKEYDEERICNKINQSEAEILFVAFGAPAQELWIYRNLPKLKNIIFAMGIGGSFDFIAGKQKRAPLFMQKIGLEWFWRVIIEPKRIKRIWNATYKFILLCVKENKKNIHLEKNSYLMKN